MPRLLDGKPLSPQEEEVWRKVFAQTGNGGIATTAVRNYRQAKRRTRPKK